MSDDHSLRARRLLLADRGFALGGGLGHLMALSVEPLIRALDQRLQLGRLSVRLPDGRVRHIGGHKPGPSAEVWLNSWRPVRRYMLGGTLGWSRSYIDGDWDSPDLVAIAELFTTNRYALGKSQKGTRLNRLINRLAHALRANTRRGARRNIAFHYDLGNDFYAARLDSGMTYSSAVFAAGDTLEAAQDRKIRRLLDSLNARPGERLLEIGCGWGGLAEIAARDYGLIVEGVTLSQAQLDYGRTRIAQAGLSDRVALRLIDYRDVEGTFDHIVSVEMLEAVGERYWQTYMDKIRGLLRPGGRAAIQVITIDAAVFETYRRGADFIQTYIFPGGMLPPVERLQDTARQAGLTWASACSFGRSYAQTLRCWRERFDEAVQHNRLPRGFDASFQRLWRYYLTYCEGGFRAGGIDVVQLLLEKPQGA